MLTKTEARIMELLSDGLDHPQDALVDCLEDSLATRVNLKNHIFNLRQKLKPERRDVVCLSRGRGKPNYRLVALISMGDV